MKQAYDQYNASQFDYATKGEAKRSQLLESFGVLDKLYGQYLPSSKDVRILDMGCGYGKHVMWLKDRGYQNVIGVDSSQSQIDQANELDLSNIIQADIVDYLKGESASFDVILGFDIIEHMSSEELINLLTIARNRLNPGGSIILQHPNPEGVFFESIYYSDITHKTAYTYKGIYQVARLAGFQDCTSYPLRPVRLGIKGKLRNLLWSCFEAYYGVLQIIERGYSSKLFTSNILTILR